MQDSSVTDVEVDVRPKTEPAPRTPLYPVVNAMRMAVPVSILLWIAILMVVFR